LQLSKKKTLGGFDNHEEKEKQIFMNLLISKAEDVLLRKRQRARKKKVNFIKDIIDPRQDVIYEIKSKKINRLIEFDMKFFGVGRN
jgi:hypothetical protein